MAEEKKAEKKGLTLFQEVMFAIIVLFFLGILSERVNDFLAYYQGTDYASIWAALQSYFFSHIVPFVKIVGFVITALATWGIVHVYIKLKTLNEEEKSIYGATKVEEDAPSPVLKNERWERVIAHLNSVNSSDWRLAVLEADIMLDELLKTLGYHGETLGERLKAVEKGDMLTLDNAWEAHRVRNQIAHAGSDYPLEEREAKRAIALYESVFKEYALI